MHEEQEDSVMRSSRKLKYVKSLPSPHPLTKPKNKIFDMIGAGTADAV